MSDYEYIQDRGNGRKTWRHLYGTKLFNGGTKIDMSLQRINQQGMNGWATRSNSYRAVVGALQGDNGWVIFGANGGADRTATKLVGVGYMNFTGQQDDTNFVPFLSNPSYTAGNFSSQTLSKTLGDQTFNFAQEMVWSDVFPDVDLEMFAEGKRFKQQVRIGTTARAAMKVPAQMVATAGVGILLELKSQDLARFHDGDREEDAGSFREYDGKVEGRKSDGTMLFSMPVDRLYVNNRNAELPHAPVVLRKKMIKRGGRRFMFVGIRASEFNSLPAGEVIFDPTFTDQPDGTDGEDSMLASGAATTNYGTSAQMWARRRLGSNMNLVIRFDISSIPASATCDNATLTLELDDVVSNIYGTTRLYKCLRDWVESEVTWNEWSSGNSWTTAGGESSGNDRSATELGSWTTSANPATIAVDLDDTEVEDEFGGSLNIIAIMDSSGSPQTHKYWSSDHTTAADRPEISIDYTEASSSGHPVHYYRMMGRR